MLLLPGYDITEVVHEDSKLTTYRGFRSSDSCPVTLKALSSEYPSAQDVARLVHEYEIVKDLKSKGILQPLRLEQNHYGPVLIQEDFCGHLLVQEIDSYKQNLSLFFQIALQLCDVLEDLHRSNIVHRSISPHNILIGNSAEEVKVVNFSMAANASKESPLKSNPQILLGPLTYISPEETGRMNREVDYRTDFYSLGVTFYEMLTGSVPFSSEDPMELMHCHIAKQPLPPHELDPSIPRVISDIVMKLLAKTAEERYQGAHGLRADLAACRDQWNATEEIKLFPLGRADISDQLPLPQKLYGREKEVASLLSAFDRVSHGTAEMVLVYGYSGIGKSALVQEIHKSILQRKGYFVSGKFDQFRRDLPYSSLIQALQELVRQILMESEERIQTWNTSLSEALGSVGQVIVDVIPEVGLIIGPQPPVPQLGPAESQNRFNLTFQKFINVFTQEEHPLVIFLDDLQWVDSASLHLIQLLISDPNSHHLLMIGAYRDNEVNAAHPLVGTLEKIEQAGAPLHRISLAPLSLNDLTKLFHDLFHRKETASQQLAELVIEKTEGNPFFVLEFLKMLHREGLLVFDDTASFDAEGGWHWDLRAIRDASITDNVVELMIIRIRRLSEPTQSVLKIAACMGNRFDIQPLSITYKETLHTTLSILRPALEEGLILPLHDTSPLLDKLDRAANPAKRASAPKDFSLSYQFLHDRVQQAAYSLISEHEKPKTHLTIGRLLLQHLQAEALEDNIFEVVNHLNFGTQLIEAEQERLLLAQLNFRAGKKAKAATAYEMARKYFEVGGILLPPDIWEKQYDFAFSMNMESAECEYLTTHFERAEKRFNVLLKEAQTALDQVAVYSLRVRLLQYLGKDNDSIETGITALKILGINLVAHPKTATIVSSLIATKWAQGRKSIEDISHLSDTMPPEKRAAMDLLINLWSSTFWINRELNALVVLQMVRLSLKWGNAHGSSFAYVCYAILQSALLGNIKAGYAFGDLAFQLAQKMDNGALKCRVHFMFAAFFVHFRNPLKRTIPYFKQGLTHGLESGEFIYAGYCSDMTAMLTAVSGSSLSEAYDQAQQLFDIVKRIGNMQSVVVNQVVQRWTSILRGEEKSPHPASNISQPHFEVDIFQNSEQSYEEELGTYYIFELPLLYIFNDYHKALETIKKLQDNTMIAPTGAYLESFYYFYCSLTLTALYPNIPKDPQIDYEKLLKNNQKMLNKYANESPENFLHKLLLVRAETARISHKFQQAADLYDQAIESARENAYIQNEAIANELAAKFYLGRGKRTIAKAYLLNAYSGYRTWGATAKAAALERSYPEFLDYSSRPEGLLSGELSDMSRFDFATVMKAARALSSEIVLGKLLEQLMRIAMENAGARKGLLMLEQGGVLVIEAERGIDTDTGTVLQSLPVETAQTLPLPIIRYVERTKEPVVLNDATQEDTYGSDPYIIREKPKSILCTPLINQGKLVGILYLENNLTVGAFTPDRLEVLNLLSSEAVTSIANARLYKNLEEANKKLEFYSKTLEQKVEERTQELIKANRALEIANEQVLEVDRRKTQFLAGMSHELRTPMTAIIGFTRLVLRKAGNLLPDRQRENLRKVQESANHLLYLINDLLDLSKIEAGRMDIHPGSFDVKQLIRSCCETVSPLLRPEVRIALDISDEVGEAYTDEVGLRHIVTNLLSNAVKFTETGVVEITVVVEDRANSLVSLIVAVSDTGMGIPVDALDTIFEEFQQVEGGKNKRKGTGLGLPIAKKWAEMLRGSLGVESEAGKGSTFTLKIPIVYIQQ